MPHMSGGGGGGNGGPITVSAAAHQKSARTLGRAALDAIRAHILDSNEFVEQLANRLRITFRGEVTAVDRDNTGKNRVYIKRTGKSAADPAPYRIWGSKMVPRVGDDLLLMRLDTGSNVLVLAGADGNHPNDLDVAYAGGAIRLNDSALLPVQKHGDDHHSRHYATNGTTIVVHHSATGEAKQGSGHYMSGGSGFSIADDGTVSGPYHKRQHNNASGKDEHLYDKADGHGLRKLREMSETESNFWLDDGSGTQIKTHSHQRSGSGGQDFIKQHGTASYHTHGDLGDGKYGATHASGNRVHTHDGTAMRLWGSNKVGLKTDGFTSAAFDSAFSDEQAGGVEHVTMTSAERATTGSGPGGHIGISNHAQSGHHAIQGVLDGNGNEAMRQRHANGNITHEHDGTTARIYGSFGGTTRKGLEVDGQSIALYDLAHSPGQPIHQFSSAYSFGGTGGGGMMRIASSGGGGAYHAYGDIGDANATIRATHASGKPMNQHDGNTHTVYSNNSEALIHDGTHLISKSGGIETARLSGVVQTSGSSDWSGFASFKQWGTLNTHTVGDDPDSPTTDLVAKSQSGNHRIRTPIGDHHHQGNAHIHPVGSRINSPSSDRLDLLDSSNAAGAIKRNSHSRYITYDDQPATIPTAAGHVLDHAAVDGYDDPHFKITQHILYYVTNPGLYTHAGTHPGLNSGNGAGTAGSSSGNAFWVQGVTNGDNGTGIYGITVTGAAWSGRSVQKNFGINV